MWLTPFVFIFQLGWARAASVQLGHVGEELEEMLKTAKECAIGSNWLIILKGNEHTALIC